MGLDIVIEYNSSAVSEFNVYVRVGKIKFTVGTWCSEFGGLFEDSPDCYRAYTLKLKTAHEVVKHVEEAWFPQIQYRLRVDAAFRKASGLPDHFIFGYKKSE